MSKPVIGQCDCCGESPRILHEAWPSGMETWACAKCCYMDEEECDEELRMATEAQNERS